MQIPDMACAIRTDIITLSGVYQLEINRFDAATRFNPWTPQHQPSEGQKKSINKFLRYLQATWADLGRSPPEYPANPTPTFTPNGRVPNGRYYCSYNPGPFPLCRCPRIQIIPGNTMTIIPDHPHPAGAPPQVPLNTHSPHSLNPYGGQPVYPIVNPNPTPSGPLASDTQAPHMDTEPDVSGQGPLDLSLKSGPVVKVEHMMGTSRSAMNSPSLGNQIKITHVRSLAGDPQSQSRCASLDPSTSNPLRDLLAGNEPIKMTMKRQFRPSGPMDLWEIEPKAKIPQLGEETVKRELTDSPASPEPQRNDTTM